MVRFRKKPVVVEAEQWFPGKHVEGVQEIAHDPGDGSTASNGYGMISTLEGPMKVSPGDWIITGVKGEKYPCKPDIFEATYEPADDPSGETVNDADSWKAVMVNGRWVVRNGSHLSHREIATIAYEARGAKCPTELAGYTVTYSHGPAERPEGSVGLRESVRLVDGLRITAMFTGNT